MINKLIYIIIVSFISLTLNAQSVLAATPTPGTINNSTPSATVSDKSVGEKLNAQINQLKERIASRVAELNLVEKRGIIGTVTDTSGNQITFSDLNGKTRYIDVDEITKFSSPSAKTGFGLSDLTKGTKISVLGLYNKQSLRILARFIDSFITPVYLSGRINDIDKKNFTISIISEDKKQTTVDIVTLTNISSHTKIDGISKLGFSNLNIGDKIMTVGFPDKKDQSLLVASRILALPELPQNTKIIIDEPTNETTTPAATSSASPTKTATKSPTPTE